MSELEEDCGTDIFLVADMAHIASTWWIETLCRRIQIGLVDLASPFSVLLFAEWKSISSYGIVHALKHLSAGAILKAAHRLMVSYAISWPNGFFVDVSTIVRQSHTNKYLKRFLVYNVKLTANL